MKTRTQNSNGTYSLSFLLGTCLVVVLSIFVFSLHWIQISVLQDPIMQPDSPGYFLPAFHLLFNGSMEISTLRTEGYPLLLYVFLLIFKNFSSVLIAQHISLILTGIVASLLYYWFFDKSIWSGIAIGWLTILSAEGMFYAHTIGPDTIFSFLFLVSILFFYATVKKMVPAWAVGTALLVCVSTTFKPVGMALIVSIGLSFLLIPLQKNKKIIFLSYCGVVIAFLMVWASFNLATKNFFGLTKHNGEVLFGAAAPFLEIDESIPEDIRIVLQPIYEEKFPSLSDHSFVMYDSDGPVAAIRNLGHDEGVLDKILKKLAFSAIRNHPIQFTEARIRDLIKYLSSASGRPPYFIIPKEYFLWIGLYRYWHSTKAIPQGRQFVMYDFPKEFFEDLPTLPPHWKDQMILYIHYRTNHSDPYLDNISSFELYPFNNSTPILKILNFIVACGPLFSVGGILLGMFFIITNKQIRLKVFPLLLFIGAPLFMNSVGGGVDGRYALPVQPLYYITFFYGMSCLTHLFRKRFSRRDGGRVS